MAHQDDQPVWWQDPFSLNHAVPSSSIMQDKPSVAGQQQVLEQIATESTIVDDEVPPYDEEYQPSNNGMMDPLSPPPPPYYSLQQQQRPLEDDDEGSSRFSEKHRSCMARTAWCCQSWISQMQNDRRLACCGCFSCCFLLVIILVLVTVFVILPRRTEISSSFEDASFSNTGSQGTIL